MNVKFNYKDNSLFFLIFSEKLKIINVKGKLYSLKLLSYLLFFFFPKNASKLTTQNAIINKNIDCFLLRNAYKNEYKNKVLP